MHREIIHEKLNNSNLEYRFQEIIFISAPKCTLPADIGKFDDTRSGGQHQTKTLELGNIKPPPEAWTYNFKYKYIIGYCTTKGKGNGPTLQLNVGSKQVWKRQLDLNTEDYPYDTGCGASAEIESKYSPEQTAKFSIPKGVGGSMVLTMIGTDRNIHVLGNGLQCPSKKQWEFKTIIVFQKIYSIFSIDKIISLKFCKSFSREYYRLHENSERKWLHWKYCKNGIRKRLPTMGY